MKLFCTLFSLGLAAMPLSASDVEQRRAEEIGKTYKVYGANNAQVYRDVTVTKITDAGILDVRPWKLAIPFSIILVILTITIYIFLGNV